MEFQRHGGLEAKLLQLRQASHKLYPGRSPQIILSQETIKLEKVGLELTSWDVQSLYAICGSPGLVHLKATDLNLTRNKPRTVYTCFLVGRSQNLVAYLWEQTRNWPVCSSIAYANNQKSMVEWYEDPTWHAGTCAPQVTNTFQAELFPGQTIVGYSRRLVCRPVGCDWSPVARPSGVPQWHPPQLRLERLI